MEVPGLRGWTFWIVSVGVVLASGLGTYAILDAEDTCEPFELPPATGGDAYHYAANGTVLLTSSKIKAGDWNVVDGPDEQGAVRLTNGSTTDVTIAPEPKEALSITGAQRPSFQVSYVVSDPSKASGLHVADEWLDAETGETTEARSPSVMEVDERVLHHRHFTRHGWAGLMHSPDLWGRSLAEGDTWNLTYREGHPNTLSHLDQASVSFTVDRLWEASQGCQARIQVNHSYADAALTLSEDVPVPTDYQTHTEAIEFQATLEDFQPGNGPNLPPIERPPHPPSGHAPHQPLQDFFLANAEGELSTDWPTALSAIENDEEAQAWLENHPNAAVTEVEYLQGHPNSRIDNRWQVTWWPGPEGGASMENRVDTRSDQVSEALDEEIAVDTSHGGHVPRPVFNETLTLPSLAELHRKAFRAPLETFRCNFASPPEGGSCVMAPHDDINKPRAGGRPGVYHAGLIVDLRDGRVLQETSFAERLIDPPAQQG